MCKKWIKEGNFITIDLTPYLSQLVKYWLFYRTSKVRSTHFHCCSKSYWGYWPYWLASHYYLNIYGRGIWTTYLLVRWFVLRYPILLFINLIYQCAEINRWLFLHLHMRNLKMLVSSSRPQMKKSSCSFNMLKLMVNERWCLIGVFDAD